MREKYTIPISQKIALDLANKIYNGDTVLRNKYNVE